MSNYTAQIGHPAETVTFFPPELSVSTHVPVQLSLKRLADGFASWSTAHQDNPFFGMSDVPDGFESIERQVQVLKKVARLEPIPMPEMSLSYMGNGRTGPTFMNGRHRTTLLRRWKVETIWVVVPRDERDDLVKRFG